MSILEELFGLDGRVAIVTGGAKGIGMFYSEALADAGANVVVADVDSQAVAETTDRLNESYPDRILGVNLDVTERESVRAMIQQVDQRWGRLDILVNNAGLYAVLKPKETPWLIPEDEFDQVMTVNVRGMYVCTVESIPLMEKNGWGRVINVASGLAFKGSPQLMHYAASKGAVVNLTRSMATALGEKGINVNAIAPGGTASPTVIAARGGIGTASGMSERTAQQRIIKRVEVPEDLVGTLLYLSSPASGFLTGQTIVVDGGTYLH
jgi:NAD(P)-dependent dehydrogenase (short-subunit alcohol dehydrogenase family)